MPDTLEALHWGPASKGAPKQLVVLCHGLGADAHDLFDLAPTWAEAVPDALFASVMAGASAGVRARAGGCILSIKRNTDGARWGG